MSIVLAYIPCPSHEVARAIGQAMVKEKLAACANIMSPVQSLYMWEGALQESQETVCLLKTQEKLFTRLRQRVEALHPYEVPCILSLPVNQGNPSFLQWLIHETSETSETTETGETGEAGEA